MMCVISCYVRPRYNGTRPYSLLFHPPLIGEIIHVGSFFLLNLINEDCINYYQACLTHKNLETHGCEIITVATADDDDQPISVHSEE